VEDLARLSGVMLKRARHVVTEDNRVVEAVEALRRDDFTTVGRLMYASHASLRDDYEVSVPQLDAFVEVAQREGALGARLTGAGFGGSAIALIDSSRVDALSTAVASEFERREFRAPALYSFLPADGAEAVE
jgi:galactokinase